jgi:hypothetical protein
MKQRQGYAGGKPAHICAMCGAVDMVQYDLFGDARAPAPAAFTTSEQRANAFGGSSDYVPLHDALDWYIAIQNTSNQQVQIRVYAADYPTPGRGTLYLATPALVNSNSQGGIYSNRDRFPYLGVTFQFASAPSTGGLNITASKWLKCGCGDPNA